MSANLDNAEAVPKTAPSEIIYLRDGVYLFNKQVSLVQNKSDSAGQFKTVSCDDDDKPTCRLFSTDPRGTTNSDDKGNQFCGNYRHIVGLTVEASLHQATAI